MGQHIHQLLRLAAALAPSPCADSACADSEEPSVAAPLGVDLAGLTDAQTIAWGQSLEQLQHTLSALQVQAAGDLAARTRAARFSDAGFTKPVALLTTFLTLSAAEASRRLRLADHFLPVTDLITTVTTPPAQPILGSAFFSGELSQEQALVVSGFADDARHLADAGRIPAQGAQDLETTLTSYAKEEPPDFLRRIGTRALNLLDPDGQQPSDGELLAKQGIFFRSPRRGLVHVDGHLTVSQYETLMSAIGWATNPNGHLDINAVDPLTEQTAAQGPADASSNGSGGVGQVPGQMDLQDFISTVSTAFGNEQAFPANAWPPPQGPIPPWAADPGAGNSGTAESCAGDAYVSVPSTDVPAPEPWPHLVNGILVPQPGYEQDLPGLDPIDPNSTDPAVADRRSHGQKLLDGLIDCVKLAARTGKLPLNGGLKSQLFISTTEAELQRATASGSGGGIAFLPYSGPQPLELFTVELCDSDVTTMVLGNGQEILNVGRTQRFFTAAQRKILVARDLGCTFPDCTALASWCDAHHIIPWQDGGDTSVANGVLLCSLHHHLVHRGQWAIEVREGVPWFIPSFWLDPTLRARRNSYHHGLARNGPPEPPEPPDPGQPSPPEAA